MTCVVCGTARQVKSWVYGTTCDKHDAQVAAEYLRWRAANAGVRTILFSVSDELDALIAAERKAISDAA